jgi:hypothetical protein
MSKRVKERKAMQRMEGGDIRVAILEAVRSPSWAKLMYSMEDRKVADMLRKMGFPEPPRLGEKPSGFLRGLLGLGREGGERKRRVVILVEP